MQKVDGQIDIRSFFFCFDDLDFSCGFCRIGQWSPNRMGKEMTVNHFNLRDALFKCPNISLLANGLIRTIFPDTRAVKYLILTMS